VHTKAELAQLQTLLAFLTVVGIADETQFRVVRNVKEGKMTILRTDLKPDSKKRYPALIKLEGVLTIIRFLHSTEMSPYELYPAYPWDRARCDQALELIA
jgi:hypothetical protein